MIIGWPARLGRLGGALLALSFLPLPLEAKAQTAQVQPSVPEPDGYRLDHYRGPVPTTLRGGRVVHTADLKVMLEADGRRPLLIDVVPAPRRPAGMNAGSPWMPRPHADIPGSVWLPDVGRGALDATMESWFRQQLIVLSMGDKARPLVFYCHPDCWMSWNAAKRAVAYGYTAVLWYPDGVEGWREAGLPLAPATARMPPGTATKGEVDQIRPDGKTHKVKY